MNFANMEQYQQSDNNGTFYEFKFEWEEREDDIPFFNFKSGPRMVFKSLSLTLIREFLGPSPSAFYRKNPESSLVTSQLGLRTSKLYVQIGCQLGYLMMLISNGIC